MRFAGLPALVALVVAGCGSDADDPAQGTPTASISEADVSDEDLIAAGLTPARTAAAACELLFGDRDGPGLAVTGASASEVGALQDVLMSIVYSGPASFRGDAGALVDHLDLAGDYADDDARAEARQHAERLAAACAA